MSYKPAEPVERVKICVASQCFHDSLECLCKMHEALAYTGSGKHVFFRA